MNLIPSELEKYRKEAGEEIHIQVDYVSRFLRLPNSSHLVRIVKGHPN
jgi:hypothetical protein